MASRATFPDAPGALITLALASFAALALFAVPFPVVIVVAGLIGWLLARLAPQTLRPPAAHTTGGGPPPLIADDALHTELPSCSRALRMVLIGLLLWAAPLTAVAAFTGTGSVFTTQGLFFSGTALVPFGGVYAVLAYVAQQAVQHYGWLGAGEMVRGLALAETTPAR
ncbi:chromate transporter [Streptomyces canus]|uniref:chromate transporter n=1 Tax=Streptomyces canus TaxID=58343 RepID=UPI002DD8898B|nr:chromate transporter [Streptomyces canus]WSD91636.1 chromate transporter [Streptomyces canus]